jgi:long-chain acyl-CoA synthetase
MHIIAAARKTPDKIAIVEAETGASVTFRELNERANQIAHFLRSLGLRRGGHVAFMLPNVSKSSQSLWQPSGLACTSRRSARI